MSDVQDLIARLRQRDTSRHGYYGHPRFNRDGEEAADTLAAQAAEIERLKRERNTQASLVVEYGAKLNALEAERDALRAVIVVVMGMIDEASNSPQSVDRWLDRMEEACETALGGQP